MAFSEGELEGVFVEISVVLLAKWVDLNHYLVLGVSWGLNPVIYQNNNPKTIRLCHIKHQN